jgi:hypothetical protein
MKIASIKVGKRDKEKLVILLDSVLFENNRSAVINQHDNADYHKKRREKNDEQKTHREIKKAFHLTPLLFLDQKI